MADSSAWAQGQLGSFEQQQMPRLYQSLGVEEDSDEKLGLEFTSLWSNWRVSKDLCNQHPKTGYYPQPAMFAFNKDKPCGDLRNSIMLQFAICPFPDHFRVTQTL